MKANSTLLPTDAAGFQRHGEQLSVLILFLNICVCEHVGAEEDVRCPLCHFPLRPRRGFYIELELSQQRTCPRHLSVSLLPAQFWGYKYAATLGGFFSWGLGI